MKQESNNEMDLLLRRLSRRQEALRSDVDSDHLDADALSSYAENALPAATRARYTEHLAECSRCRELVVQLSASVALVAAKETLTIEEPSGLRKFLASLFSPMVLRYAVPALGLIVVAAIGFGVLRSRQQGETSVAQLEGYQQTKPAEVPNQQPEATSQAYDSAAKSEARPTTPTRETQAGPKETGPASPPNAPPTVSSVRVEPKTEAPATKAEQQTVTSAQPAQPTPTPAETADEIRVDINAQRTRGRTETTDLAKQKAGERNEAKKAEAESAASRAPRPAGTLSVGSAQEKDRDDGVIRSVAGRRFRKQSGVWVDTAYSSGGAITHVGRGSEQYRALVADEPSIKTIADELDGPFIVVWKGRTYRIH
jgi:hypothetical protein